MDFDIDFVEFQTFAKWIAAIGYEMIGTMNIQ